VADTKEEVDSMFVMKTSTTINGKKYDHYKLAESYKEKGKVKHRILYSFGNMSEEDGERLKAAFSAYSNPDIIVSRKNEIVVTKNIKYLVQLHESSLSDRVVHNCWIMRNKGNVIK